MVATQGYARSAALAGRTVLVTGAGSGIGRATAGLAAAAGATVLAADIKGQDATAEAIMSWGGRAEGHLLDVTDSSSWSSVVADVLAAHGRVDGLANIAGIVEAGDNLVSQTEEGWDRILGVDLKGAFLGMKSLIGHFLDSGGGKVVNIASTAGLIGMADTLAYSAAKGGVIAMSRQVAIEYAAANVQVNVIAPGVTQTPMLGDITEELLAAVSAATPMHRLGDPEDVGGVVCFLLGPGSDFITGQVIPVDGGWTAQ